jgi:hypothetical protein
VSQDRVTEAVWKLETLLERETSSAVSTVDVSYYRSNLIGLEREIEKARCCGDTGPYIARLLDQLQPVRKQLFECELALLNQERDKINHRIELTRAFQEFSKALENTGVVMINSLGDRVIFTFSGYNRYLRLRFIGKEIQARYIASMDYDFESLARLFLAAKAKTEEES